MASGISIREFARRDGCSDTLVRRALKAGHLKAFADGSLDPALVGTGWRGMNRRGGANSSQGSRPAALPDETAEEAARRIVMEEGRAPYDLAEAERIKENYLALLRQLEYDTKSGRVVEIEHVAGVHAQRCARLRTRLLAIPSKLAPRLLGVKTAPEIQDQIQEAIAEALEELTRDDGGERD